MDRAAGDGDCGSTHALLANGKTFSFKPTYWFTIMQTNMLGNFVLMYYAVYMIDLLDL